MTSPNKPGEIKEIWINPINAAQQGRPNYPVGNYSPAGRAGWVELNYHFGG